MRTANIQFTVMKTEGYGFDPHLGGDASAEQLNGQSITTKKRIQYRKRINSRFSQTSNPATCNKGNTHYRKDVYAVRRNKLNIARVEQRQLIWLITRRQRSNRSRATMPWQANKKCLMIMRYLGHFLGQNWETKISVNMDLQVKLPPIYLLLV